jgi:hypothetical protein
MNGKAVAGPAGGAGTAQLKTHGGPVVPAATVYAARINSKVELAFNFTGPFRWSSFFAGGGWVALDDSQHQ